MARRSVERVCSFAGGRAAAEVRDGGVATVLRSVAVVDEGGGWFRSRGVLSAAGAGSEPFTNKRRGAASRDDDIERQSRRRLYERRSSANGPGSAGKAGTR